MNKNLYRIVFNQSRGQLMAVAETAGAQGKSASGERASTGTCPMLSTLSLCIGLAMGIMLTDPAQAQIKADASAPQTQQPVILQTASGVTQVNIATPSAAGVSRNTYSQFDVQQRGVILNNSNANVLTQLGGFAQGNPMLAAGSARVILNEINSSNPSYINGYIEVAGQRAEVIIANPSGINVNGGGFINASRATLTTGAPIVNGGSLDGYLVQRGNINISGAGLDASTTDYTGILARAVQVNAGIWAKELKVVAGANQVNADQTTATPITGTGAAPAFAIDVAQLGGMYAGKITLIGTEAGLGVSNSGVIGATAGDVVVQANGWLTNSGNIQATGNTSITTQGNITNTRLIAAQGNTTLQASGAGANISSAAGSVIAAGLNADGTVKTTGNLSITATGTAALNGQTAAGGNASVSAAQINTRNGTLTAQNVNLAATGANGSIDNTQGTIASTSSTAGSGKIVMTAASLNNSQGTIAGQDITATLSSSLDNSAGKISADNTITLQDTAAVKALAITNAGGNITAGQSTTLNAATLSNGGSGKVQSRGDVSLALSSDFSNQGDIVANNNLSFTTSGNLTNSGKFESGNLLSLSAAVLDNTSTLVGKDVAIKATTRVLNRGPQAFIGASSSTGLLEILASEIINWDDSTATDTAAQTSIIGLGRMVLAGGKDGAGNYLAANSVRNESARIASTGDMMVVANVLTNTRRVLTTGAYSVTGSDSNTQVWSPGNPDAPGGRYVEPPRGGAMNSDYLYTAYTGTISTNSIDQISPKAVIESGGNLTPVVSQFNNYFSAVTAAGNIPLNGVTLDQNSWVNGPSGSINPYGKSVVYSGAYTYRTYKGAIWGIAFGPTAPVFTALPGYDSSFTAGGTISGAGNTLLNTAGVNPNTPLGTQSGVGTGTSSSPVALPSGGLFRQTTDPTSKFLVETNPAFTNNRLWLSSDYYFTQLGQDPTTIQKRLGDGYYEQQRVREQIMGLTGRAVLEYADAQTQFQALMLAGAQLARSLNLAPGIALSAAQVAQLASDVVIMQEVIVAGQAVLTPVVYLSANSPNSAGRLLTTGPLIAANSIDLTNSQNITNSDTIRATQGLNIAALSIDSRGGQLQSGGQMSLTSQKDIDLTSAQVKAGSLSLDATRNLILSTDSTQVSSQVEGGTRQSTRLGQTASIDVTGNASIKTGNNFIQNAGNLTVGGNLTAQIGGDWQIGAVQNTDTINAQTQGGFSNTQVVRQATSGINVAGNTNINVANNFTAQGANISLTGPATVQAGGNITLSAVKDSISVDAASSSSDHQASTQSFNETLRGTNLQTANNVSLIAGRNINLQASSVNAAQGAASLQAAGSVTIESATERHDNASTHVGTKSNLFSSSTTTERKSSEQSINIGSSVSGATVNVIAGTDINVKGSSVISDTATTLTAGNNVNIEAATDTSRQTSFSRKEESGFLSGGGLGVTFGSRDQSNDQKGRSTTAAASTVGSIGGNVNINAGQTFRQVGSDVMAPSGDINITAKKVDIVEARETTNSTTETRFRQSGISVGISSPIISAIQQGQAMAQAASQTSDGRMQALAGSATAFSLYNNAGEIAKSAQALTSGNPTSAGSISVSFGTSKSQSNSASQSDSARGSSVAAGNNVNITATGAGIDSNILVQGSDVKAGGNTTLAADNKVNLLAAQNTSSQSSTNSSSSSSVGVSYGAGGFGFSVSASKGQGSGNGADASFTNTNIAAGNTATIQSGQDTNIKGAVVSANQIKATVGGNLNIESLQDTSTYTSQQSSAGASLSFGGGGISGGGVSASKSNIDSNFQSVNQQSGLKAGDGGFQVSVNNNTAITGSVIASTQAAVDNNKNTFTTGGTLSIGDVQNQASFTGTATGFSIDVGQQNGKFGVGGVGVGLGSDKGNAASTSSAGMSGIAGNTAVRTGDAETGLKPIFDAAKVQREINAQVAITQAFSKEAPKAVATYAQTKYDELKTTNPNEAKKWAEGGIYRVALHTLTGALSGGVSGAAGAAASASAAPLLNNLQDGIASSLQAEGLGADAAKGIAQSIAGLTAAGVGAAVGGAQGAATSLTVDTNNRQLHPTEVQIIKQNAERYAKILYGTDKPTPAQVEGATAALVNTAQNVLDNNLGAIVPYSKDADNFLQTLKVEYQQQNGTLKLPDTAGTQQLFYAAVDQKNQPWLNQGLADSKITGLIVRTPISAAVNNPTSDPTRDRLTGLPLDDRGRYQVQVSLDDKNFAPKYFPCANTDCIRSGQNLDKSDPGTQAYLKALDKKVFDDLNKVATVATIVSPVGVVASIAAIVGPITSVTSGYLDGQFVNAATKEAIQIAATQYLQRVYKIGEAVANRITATVDLAGGWQAFVDRAQSEANGTK